MGERRVESKLRDDKAQQFFHTTKSTPKAKRSIVSLRFFFFFSVFIFLAACLDLVELAGEAHEVDRGGVGQRGHHRPVEPENALVAYVEMRRCAPEVRDGQVAGPPVEPQHLSARPPIRSASEKQEKHNVRHRNQGRRGS